MAVLDDVLEGGFPWTEGALRRWLEWLFLTGNRLTIAGGLAVGVYVLMVATDLLAGAISRERLAPLNYLFSALTAGNFTLITIVLSINQLVISRQLGTPGELREEIEATNNYREEIEEALPGVHVAPVTPTEFLHLLLRSCADCVDRLRSEAAAGEADAWEELWETADGIEAHVDRVESVLSRPDVGLFAALTATLGTNYSKDIYRLRHLRASHHDVYPEAVNDSLDRLVVRLQQIDVARQYVKTLYIQNELSRLSRHLLYVGVPAVLVSAFVLRVFAVGAGAFGAEDLFAFVPLAVTVAVTPLAVLFAYVLRLTTVARRTVAITPFTTATQEMADDRSLEDEVDPKW